MLRRLLLTVLFLLGCAPVLGQELVVTVDLSEQAMSVRIEGETEYVWPVSTGRKRYPTPVGTFRPIRMYRSYFSKKYENAPMPHAIFFYGGYAIHGTTEVRQLGRPVSHGCVRLHPSSAALLYDLVSWYGTDNTLIRIRR